jgi:tetratricopeptide (TPR) repeat protein
VEVREQKVLAPGLATVATNSEKLTAAPPPIPKSVESAKPVAEQPATDNMDQKLAYDLFTEGYAYLKLQKDREAVKAFKDSIKLNSNSAETYYGLGFSNFRLARFKEAADAFKKATTLQPGLAKAHYGLSLAYQELNNASGVLEEYKILETLDKSLAKKLAQTFPQYNFSCRLVRGCP